MFRSAALEKRLSEHKEIAGQFSKDQISASIDKAYAQALPLLQRKAWSSTLFLSGKPASEEDMVELLKGYVLLNLNPKQFEFKL